MNDNADVLNAEHSGRGFIRDHKAVFIAICSLLIFVYATYLYFERQTRMVFAIAVVGLLIIMIPLVIKNLKSRVGAAWIKSDLTPFVSVMLLQGILFSLVFTPGSVPDESYHFNSAYKYSNAMMGVDTPDFELAMRVDDIAFQDDVMSSLLNRDGYRKVASNFSLLVDDSSYSFLPVDSNYSISSNSPLQRVPAALGIVFAKLLGLGSVPLFYLGRIFNLLYGIILISLAIYITPVGKNIFKAVALLPMTLHVLSSYSYDVAAIGFSFLFVALILRAFFSDGFLANSVLISLLIVSLFLGPCKTIYSFLTILVIAIPGGKFKTKKQEVFFKLLVVLLPFMGVAILRIVSNMFASPSVPSVAGGSASLDIRGDETGTFYNLPELISDPVFTFRLFMRTFEHFGGSWVNEMIGMSLGWFQSQIIAPGYMVFIYFSVLLFSSVRSQEDAATLSAFQKLLSLSSIALIIVAVIAALATSFTFNVEPLVHGVQGRYFLQFLPLLLICIRSSHLFYDRQLDVLNIMVILNVFYILRVSAIALSI